MRWTRPNQALQLTADRSVTTLKFYETVLDVIKTRLPSAVAELCLVRSMRRALSICIAATLSASAFAQSSRADDCWCSKNGNVFHVSQSECDAIGGTGYKSKEQAAANALTGLSNRDSFHEVFAAASKKFDANQGYEYVKKFEDWISDAATHALDACGSMPRTNLRCDIVFLIASDGRIQKMLLGPNNSFEQCVSNNFRPAAIAPRPPADSWPMHIRILDGGVPRYKGGDPPFVFFSNAKSYREQ
jgi:hypothetical protein